MAQPSTEPNPEPATPSEEPTTPAPLVAPSKRGGSRALTVVLVVIIVVLAGILAAQTFHLLPGSTTSPGTSGSVSVQSVSPTATAGQPVTFTATNLPSGDTLSVNWGDGQATQTGIANTTFQHVYQVGGDYLIWFGVVASNGTVMQQNSQSLYTITILPDVPIDLGQYVAVPTVYFNNTVNPTAPVTAVNTPMGVYGSFTESSALYASSSSFFNVSLNTYSNSTVAVSIDHYEWDFGNGQTKTVQPDPSTLEPALNPVNETYSQSGLYAAQLTLFTVETLTTQNLNVTSNVTWTNTTTINTYSVTVGATIPVGSYHIGTAAGNAPNPGTITEIVNSPGGPYSFDPQIDYETTGFEVVVNTQATLLFYNGSSTTNWFPYVASEVPSVANGGITNNYTSYAFPIRSNMFFSNGDPITAYDVWYTMLRAMLFQGGYPGTADWIVSKYVLEPAPPVGNGYFTPFAPLLNDTQSAATQQAIYNDIINAVTYDNSTNTVTFHLYTATPPGLFFTSIDDALGTGIMDASWLQSVGAGITFSPAGFLAYENQANEGNYNLQAQFSPVTSGPFAINSYVPSTAVVLTPNKYFPGLPEIPKPTTTVVIEWVASPAVAYQKFLGGEGDIVTILPTPYYKVVNDTMVASHNAVITGPFASITEYFAPFNVNIDTSLLSSLGTYSIPSNYFANPLVREAYAYAFDYSSFVNNILGNAKYGFEFGSGYCGVIDKGLPDYVPPANLTGCPTYDLAMAKSLLYASGAYNTTVNFPVIMPTGDTVDNTAAIAWGQALASIDPHITMTPLFQNFDTIIGDQVPGSDPMPVFFLGWIADYPYPSDYTDAMLQVGGTYPAPNGWDPTYLNGLASTTTNTTLAGLYGTQASAFSNMSALITAADAATSATQAQQLYQQAEQYSISLYMYVYTYQATGFWITRPWIHPYQNNWGLQENPTIGAGADSLFFWWVKG